MSLVPVKGKLKLPLPANQSGSSCPNPCPKQGQLKQVPWGQLGFDCSRLEDATTSLDNHWPPAFFSLEVFS